MPSAIPSTSSQTKSRATAEEYLAQERLATTKHEYYRGEVIARDQADFWHTCIKDRLGAMADKALEGSNCQALTSDLRVKAGRAVLYTYPDVVIFCGQPQFEDSHQDTLLNPQVLVEVFSDATEGYDRGRKFVEYLRIPSLREYVLGAQNSPLIERFVRNTDDTWLLSFFNGLAADFELASVPVRIPMAEIYRGVEFPPEPGASTEAKGESRAEPPRG